MIACCSRCGQLFEASSQEDAYTPGVLCVSCYKAEQQRTAQADTQEDGAAVADLDALPVVCPSCAAARAVSLGRRGARHYFSCKECGEEFWLQEFDDRTQEDGRPELDEYGRRRIVVSPEVGESPEHLRNSYIAASILLRELSFAPDTTAYSELRAVADRILSRLGNMVSWYSFFGQEIATATPATTQEAQPVPVAAIAYIMADIAPTDAADVQKLHESRAAVLSWLESLEAEEDGAE